MTPEQRKELTHAVTTNRLLPEREYQRLMLLVLTDILVLAESASKPAPEPVKPAATKPTRRRSRGAKKGD